VAEALARDVGVALPAIGVDQAARLHDVDDEALEARGVDVGDLPQADAADVAGVHLDGDDDDRPVDRPAACDARLLLAQVGGNPQLRHGLYMATFAAVQRNPWLGAYYTRLKAAGKPPKVALVATMRKLLCAVYAVAKSRRPFVCPVSPTTPEASPESRT
jgi:hypothetical protein